MPRYKIETREQVHGVYFLEADNEPAARTLFEAGEVTRPYVYEAIDSTIESIEEAKETK